VERDSTGAALVFASRVLQQIGRTGIRFLCKKHVAAKLLIAFRSLQVGIATKVTEVCEEGDTIYPTDLVVGKIFIDFLGVNAYIVCMWKFTKHAQLRMAERNVTEEQILQILDGNVTSIVYQSPVDKEVDMYFGKTGNKCLMIPVNRTTRSVITVRPMRKNEKKLFMSEVQDG
jgi:hypothetical protein